ncbi:MAG: hypothetical protein Q8R36_01835 [bacterium]|nr:hypothetical protein [bacterium]
MKNRLLVFAVLIAMLAIIFFWKKIVDVAYELRYWNTSDQIQYSIDENVKAQFEKTQFGSFGGSGVKVSYGYFYDAKNGKYYYAFINHRATLACVNSRLLAVLIGQTNIAIKPNQTAYITINNTKPPVYKTELMYVSNCRSSFSGEYTYVGGSATLGLPRD